MKDREEWDRYSKDTYASIAAKSIEKSTGSSGEIYRNRDRKKREKERERWGRG